MRTFLTTTAFSVAFVVSAGMASAATYVYDFKAAAEPSGIGESAWTSYDTTDYFTGPGLTITADNSASDGQDYVYFDANNAGLGVCGAINNSEDADQITESGSNLCNPSGDDGLTVVTESLFFEAQEAMIIDSIYLNSNHDNASILDTIWEVVVDGVALPLFSAPFVQSSVSGTGDIMLTLGFTLQAGEIFSISGTEGPNSYVSAIGVSPVPLPAAGFLLLGGLGGLAAMKRRRKS